MIYVFQDVSKIPASWLKQVAALQKKLDALPTVEERKAFVDKKSAIWGKIKGNLLKMSHGKCWYSEAPDAVSDWHVDHYRPKGRAVDDDGKVYEGYVWLAFDWKNYRIAGSYPNSPHSDEDAKVRGKWNFFPLGKGSARATWANRDLRKEICLILDPTKKGDPKQITFDEDGVPKPSDPKNAIARKKVERTVHYLYLDSPRLLAARKKKWRETYEWIEEYREVCPDDFDQCTQMDVKRFDRVVDRLVDICGPTAAYASTARACLRANSLDFLIPAAEDRASAA